MTLHKIYIYIYVHYRYVDLYTYRPPTNSGDRFIITPVARRTDFLLVNGLFY